MACKELTAAELLLLGLIAEMPRHGYELEQVIQQRGMREWTQIGFSSIYFVLGKLEQMKLVAPKRPKEPKARKVYAISKNGRSVLASQTLAALREVRPTYSSVLPGMINWPALSREEALDALRARGEAIAAEVDRLRTIQTDQQPLPDFVEALFEHSIGQLTAERDWTKQTLDYMTSKPWLD